MEDRGKEVGFARAQGLTGPPRLLFRARLLCFFAQPVNGEVMHFEVVLRAQREVLTAMERKYFRKFLDSTLYADYRRERAAAAQAGYVSVALGERRADGIGTKRRVLGCALAAATRHRDQPAALAVRHRRRLGQQQSVARAWRARPSSA